MTGRRSAGARGAREGAGRELSSRPRPPLPPLGVRPYLCIFVASQRHPESGTSKVFVKRPLLLTVLHSPSSPCRATKEASGPGHLQTRTGRQARSGEAAGRRDGPRSGWRGAPAPEGPGGGRRGEARCGDACPGGAPVRLSLCPLCFMHTATRWGQSCGQRTPRLWQLGGQSPGVRGSRGRPPDPGAESYRTRSWSGDETSLASDSGLQKGGLEGPTGTTLSTLPAGCVTCRLPPPAEQLYEGDSVPSSRRREESWARGRGSLRVTQGRRIPAQT